MSLAPIAVPGLPNAEAASIPKSVREALENDPKRLGDIYLLQGWNNEAYDNMIMGTGLYY